MRLALPSSRHWPPFSNLSLHRGAGNIARSRLSGGSSQIRTRPGKCLRGASQPRLNRVLLNVDPNTFKLCIRPNQMVIAFLLPKRPVRTQQRVGLVSSESLQRAQPFGGRHMRRSRQMNVIRHYHESMEIVSVQDAVSVPQRCHHHLCNFRPLQGQWAAGACVEQPVGGYECLACRDESRWWEYAVGGKTAMQPEGDEQRLFDHVPMGQPPLIMPHTSSRCFRRGEIFRSFKSRLKAGCGQYCPPYGAL
jgi:hypothetical protein